VKKFYEVGLIYNGLPVIGSYVHQSSYELDLEIGVLAALLDHEDVLFEVLVETFAHGTAAILGHVSDHLEKQGIIILCGSSYKLVYLIILGNHLRVSLVGGEVNCQGNELLAHDGLRTMDN
jgi:hypothetical protein